LDYQENTHNFRKLVRQVEFSEVYKKMQLELEEACCYNSLFVDMQSIHQNYLQPQGLVEIVNCNKVRITDKGRRVSR
jgi:hypothetical protein